MNKIEVMLVHPSSPIWSKKDIGLWSIPKGLPEKDGQLLDTAKRGLKKKKDLELTVSLLI